jgi:hypothetical protein
MNTAALIIAGCVIAFLIILAWKARNMQENYNAGNNIDFDKTKTDKNIPEAVLSKSDAYFPGGRFDYIMN